MLLNGRFQFHKNHPHGESWAITPPDCRLARLIEPPAGTPAQYSGLRLLSEGRDAYIARLALAELAEHSLDAQYFIWEDDRVGMILIERLLAAAERGVRVRLLIDDIHNSGRDLHLATLDAHPNVEVRIFNPFGERGWQGFKALELLWNFSRLNHRMHNKAWIADNRAAIIGGRNIGEHYFGLHRDANFQDLDVLSAGPIVQSVSEAFDLFWNSPQAIGIGALVLRRPSYRSARKLRRKLARHLASLRRFPYPTHLDPLSIEQDLQLDWCWASAELVHDTPDKVGGGESPIWNSLSTRLVAIQKECLLESAYFVPGQPGLTAIDALTARGVRVRALTNSLASTDVIAAHAGYANRRSALLKSGVELYEMRPDSPLGFKRLFKRRRRSRAALHAKAAVFDDNQVMIGSFNLDMRSTAINTEMVLFADCKVLAEQVRRVIESALQAEHSWRVKLEDGALRWHGPAHERVYRREPQAGFWRRVAAFVFSLLPLEKQV